MREEEIILAEQQRIFRILSQSVTELAVNIKNFLETWDATRSYFKGGDYEKFQLKVQDQPHNYHLLTVETGSEEAFRDLLERNGIDYMYTNSAALQNGAGGYVIHKNDAERLKKMFVLGQEFSDLDELDKELNGEEVEEDIDQTEPDEAEKDKKDKGTKEGQSIDDDDELLDADKNAEKDEKSDKKKKEKGDDDPDLDDNLDEPSSKDDKTEKEPSDESQEEKLDKDKDDLNQEDLENGNDDIDNIKDSDKNLQEEELENTSQDEDLELYPEEDQAVEDTEEIPSQEPLSDEEAEPADEVPFEGIEEPEEESQPHPEEDFSENLSEEYPEEYSENNEQTENPEDQDDQYELEQEPDLEIQEDFEKDYEASDAYEEPIAEEPYQEEYHGSQIEYETDYEEEPVRETTSYRDDSSEYKDDSQENSYEGSEENQSYESSDYQDENNDQQDEKVIAAESIFAGAAGTSEYLESSFQDDNFASTSQSNPLTDYNSSANTANQEWQSLYNSVNEDGSSSYQRPTTGTSDQATGDPFSSNNAAPSSGFDTSAQQSSSASSSGSGGFEQPVNAAPTTTGYDGSSYTPDYSGHSTSSQASNFVGDTQAGHDSAEHFGGSLQEDFYSIKDDTFVGRADSRKHDSFDNAVVETLLEDQGASKQSAFGKGVKQSRPVADSLMSGGVVRTDMMYKTAMESGLRGLSEDEISIVNAAMQAEGLRSIDLSTISSTQTSVDNYHAFLSKMSIVDDRSVSHLKGGIVTGENARVSQRSMLKGVKQGPRQTSGSYSQAYLSNLAKNNKKIQDILDKNPDALNGLSNKLRKNAKAFENRRDSAIRMASARNRSSMLAHPLNNNWAKQAKAGDPGWEQLDRAAQMPSKVTTAIEIKNQLYNQKLLMDKRRLSKKNMKYRSKAKKRQLELGSKHPGGRSDLDKKLAKYRDKSKKSRLKYEKIEKKQLRVEGRLDKRRQLKQRAKDKIKNSAANTLKKTKAGNKILSAGKKAMQKKLAAREWLQKRLIMRAFKRFNVIASAIKKVIMKVMLIILKPIIIALLVAFLLIITITLVTNIIDMIVPFTTGDALANDPDEDPQVTADTTLGMVYEYMVEEEGNWAKHLCSELFTAAEHSRREDMFMVEDLYYTNFLSNGDLDIPNYNIEAEDYIPYYLMPEPTEYTVADGGKGPEPFYEAPEEAYKWIKIIDGGFSVQFRGVGNGAGFISNAREISAMATVTQIESEQVSDDYPEDQKSDLDDSSSFLSNIGNFFTRMKLAIKAAAEKLKNTINDIANWWHNHSFVKQGKPYMLYAKAVFDQSHREAYQLSMALHPTKRTIEWWEPEENQQEVTMEEDRVVFVGDSRTIDMFADSDAEIRGAVHDGITVYAKHGCRFDYLGEALGDMGYGNFDTVITWLGANDGGNFSNYEAAYSNLLNIGKKLIVCTVGPTDDSTLASWDHPDYENDKIIQFNDALKQWAYAHNVQVIDLYSNISGSVQIDPADGIHYLPRPTSSIWSYIVPNSGVGAGGGTSNVDVGEEISGYVDADGTPWYFMCSGNEDQVIKGKDKHKGYGCKSYDDFTYKYDSDDQLYWEDVYVEQVEPAWKIDKFTDVCVAPGDNPERWLNVMRDPWDGELLHYDGIRDGEYTGYIAGFGQYGCWVGGLNGGTFEDETSHDVEPIMSIEYAVGGSIGYGSVNSSTGGETYTLKVYEEDAEFDEYGNCIKLSKGKFATFTHNCVGGHTGYYCGGHFKLHINGLIYHFTQAQRMQNQTAFAEKNNEANPYIVGWDGSDPGFDEDKMHDAEDLFDVDCAIYHRYGVVASYFNQWGWNYDNMNYANSKLDDDWYGLYKIYATGNVDYLNGVGSIGEYGLPLIMSDSEIDDILAAMDAQYAGDPSWPQRRQALATAFYYVGKISYSQRAHGSALTEGGQNDCSGFVSRVWYDKLGSTYTTSTFRSSFHQNSFAGGGAKPGDILLHFPANGSAAHALLYIGYDEKYGHMSIDCSNGGVKYRHRSGNYYNECTYISMG